MQFGRGRKKNQLIWSFILKYIASQRSVKVMFLIKSEKENASGENTLSKQRRRTRDFALSLNQSGWARGSLKVGPGGPLVRFDQSPSLPFLWPNRGGGSGDLRRRTVVPRGHPSAGMDPPLVGGPPGGCWAGGDGGSHRRRALRRTVVREQRGLRAMVVLGRG